VQQAIQALEESIYDGFPYCGTTPWRKLFLKGIGDGVMIVSQADWYKEAPENQQATSFRRGHARKFLQACERAVSAGRERLASYNFPLAMGCGIASGELDRVFLFGRFDFIGPAANEAAKLQQHAWNEICITREFGAVLNADEWSLETAWSLSNKGWRLRFPDAQQVNYGNGNGDCGAAAATNLTRD
jgi:class 3 adenylate cyclase